MRSDHGHLRYYMAEGVKLYSQETWRRFLDGEGRTMVAKHAPAVVQYYVEMTDVSHQAAQVTGSSKACVVVQYYVKMACVTVVTT